MSKVEVHVTCFVVFGFLILFVLLCFFTFGLLLLVFTFSLLTLELLPFLVLSLYSLDLAIQLFLLLLVCNPLCFISFWLTETFIR